MSAMKDLLELPSRTSKPRQEGITHVLDRGLSVGDIDGLVEIAGDYIDIVKLGWGTAVATGNLEAKLARYKEHGITVMFGGTLTELAIAQNRLARLYAVGRGVPKNLVEAAAWHLLAAGRGLADAWLDQALKDLPPDQRTIAEKLAAQRADLI